MALKISKIGFSILLLTTTSSAFGQQLLWSTVEKDSLKELNLYVRIDSVTEKVLEFYDLYRLYYDFTGFSKDAAFDFGQILSSDERKKIEDIKDLTVIAVRANLGKGSFIVVYCINQNNFNAIIFSNTAFISGMDYMFTSSSDGEREKFTKWFKTLLN